MRVLAVIVVWLAVGTIAYAASVNWKRISVDKQDVVQYQKQDGSVAFVDRSVFVRLKQGVDPSLFAARNNLKQLKSFDDGLLLFGVVQGDVVLTYNLLLQDADVQQAYLNMVQKARLR